MSAAEQLALSYDEYLALERATGLRHQYIDGVAYAMAGAEPEHANVTANAIAALATLLRGGRCRVFSSDLKLPFPRPGTPTTPARRWSAGRSRDTSATPSP